MVVPLHDDRVSDVRPALLVLQGCGIHPADRLRERRESFAGEDVQPSKEIAIRTALGASSARLCARCCCRAFCWLSSVVLLDLSTLTLE